jgi:hypothetical protein
MSVTTTENRTITIGKAIPMSSTRVKNRSAGVGRLVRRLERERKNWNRAQESEVPTAQAWRAGVAEGIRLSQVAIRKGV